MKLGYIGLGKMGFNMVERLLDKKYHVIVYDRNEEQMRAAAGEGAHAAGSLKDMAAALAAPRLFWIMVPFQAVDAVLKELLPLLVPGDTLIDGGNSPYKHSIRRAAELAERGIDFLDAGVSGGPRGARKGACIMVGGKEEVFRKQEQLFRDLSVDGGYLYAGKTGAGHFAKMVHNGIEYGMMQALGEGFAVLKSSPFEFNLARIADLYNHRSVIESRLVGWLKDAYEQYGDDLKEISGSPGQSGEAMWTVEAAREFGIPVPVIKEALDYRLQSQKKPGYTGKVVSVLRHQFGGHEFEEKEEETASSGVKEETKTGRTAR